MISLFNRLRSLFLSPNSHLELWLRTIFHKLNATRLFFHFHHMAAVRSYQRWRSSQVKKALPKSSEFSIQPKVSFILNFPAGETQKIISTLESLRNLEGDNWEVLLITPAEDFKTKLPEHLAQDPRIKLLSQHLQNYLLSAIGDYVLFCQPGDRFFKSLLTQLYKQIENGISADLYYYDCEYKKENSKLPYPFFKPSTLSPALLLSVNYLSRAFINRSALQKVMPFIDTEKSLLSQEYDVVFWLYEKDKNIHHIPAVLVSQEDLPQSNSPETQKVVVEHLSRQGLKEVTCTDSTSGSRFTWTSGSPKTAIIIPSKNNRTLLENLINSIFTHTHTMDFSIHIVDNGSDDPSTLNYYKTISRKPTISIIEYDAPFNYSEAINLGVAKSASELVLILNDDMKIIDDSWLNELSQWATRPEIGVIGAKLLRANHTIQHGGIIIGLNGFAGHIYLNAPEHYQGLFGSTDWYRDYLAVTGACQMMRREVFNEAGGYNKGYQLAFGDIDFCLRVNQLGYRNIYTPHTRLFHYEGKSRGYITPKEDVLKGLEEMQAYLEKGDPYFSPTLTYTRIPKCVTQKQSQQSRMEQIEIRKQFYLKK